MPILGPSATIDFPSLSRGPDREGFTWEPLDATIRDAFEDGYENTRTAASRLRYQASVRYSYLKQSDFSMLAAFIDSIKVGAEMFNWTHPSTGSTYVMRLSGPPKQAYAGYDTDHLWHVTLDMREA